MAPVGSYVTASCRQASITSGALMCYPSSRLLAATSPPSDTAQQATRTPTAMLLSEGAWTRHLSVACTQRGANGQPGAPGSAAACSRADPRYAGAPGYAGAAAPGRRFASSVCV